MGRRIDDGTTNNIYESWNKSIIEENRYLMLEQEWGKSPYKLVEKYRLKGLDEFDYQELEHLKWLIQQQLDVLSNKEIK